MRAVSSALLSAVGVGVTWRFFSDLTCRFFLHAIPFSPPSIPNTPLNKALLTSSKNGDTLLSKLMFSEEANMPNEINLGDWDLLAQVSQAFRSVSDTFMDQVDMHRAQAFLLCRLFEKDGMTQSELAQQLSVRGATITNMLQRMEETGLVTRRRDLEDNRLVRVYLTDVGRDKERTLNQQLTDLEETIFVGISQEDRVVLRRLLEQVLSNLTAYS